MVDKFRKTNQQRDGSVGIINLKNIINVHVHDSNVYILYSIGQSYHLKFANPQEAQKEFDAIWLYLKDYNNV